VNDLEFQNMNQKLRRRQAEIRRVREQAEPIRIGEVLPAVMAAIRLRMKEAKSKK